MKYPLLIVTSDGQEVLLNEEMICSVTPIGDGKQGVKVKMANGDEFLCTRPPFAEWKADEFIRY